MVTLTPFSQLMDGMLAEYSQLGLFDIWLSSVREKSRHILNAERCKTLEQKAGDKIKPSNFLKEAVLKAGRWLGGGLVMA